MQAETHFFFCLLQARGCLVLLLHLVKAEVHNARHTKTLWSEDLPTFDPVLLIPGDFADTDFASVPDPDPDPDPAAIKGVSEPVGEAEALMVVEAEAFELDLEEEAPLDWDTAPDIPRLPVPVLLDPKLRLPVALVTMLLVLVLLEPKLRLPVPETDPPVDITVPEVLGDPPPETADEPERVELDPEETVPAADEAMILRAREPDEDPDAPTLNEPELVTEIELLMEVETLMELLIDIVTDPLVEIEFDREVDTEVLTVPLTDILGVQTKRNTLL